MGIDITALHDALAIYDRHYPASDATRRKVSFLRFMANRIEEDKMRAERVGPYKGLDDWDLQP